MAFPLDNLICFHDLDNDGDDDSTGGFNGTVSGATFDGTYGNFDGINDNVVTARLTAIDGATNVSYAAWINRSNTGHTVCLGRPSTSTAVGTKRISLIWYSDGNIYFNIDQAASTQYCYCALSGTGLHSIVCTFDGSQTGDANRFKVYIDGSGQSLTFAAGSGVPSTIPSDATGWTYGQDSSDRYGGGQIRCGAVWSATLTSGNATTWHNSGTPKKYADWAGGGGATMAAVQYYMGHAMTGR